jgi:hypothetical protein
MMVFEAILLAGRQIETTRKSYQFVVPIDERQGWPRRCRCPAANFPKPEACPQMRGFSFPAGTLWAPRASYSCDPCSWLGSLRRVGAGSLRPFKTKGY